MELQPIDYTQHASSQLCQMSFSDLLNQTSNNFDYNINSVSFISFYVAFNKIRDQRPFLVRFTVLGPLRPPNYCSKNVGQIRPSIIQPHRKNIPL